MSPRPVRPKDAGSLILLRHPRAGPEVLMGRRLPRARFIPDAYVFPGGKVDAADRRAVPASDLPAGLCRHMAVAGDEAAARALAVAAVRETFEETGLLLGGRGDVGAVGGHGWDGMKAAGQAPALAGLDYLGRAITPPMSPIRFHARFFIADAAGASGTLGGSGELLDLGWVPLADAFDLPIVDVTEFMLGEVWRRFSEALGLRRRHSFFRYRNNQMVVSYSCFGIATTG